MKRILALCVAALLALFPASGFALASAQLPATNLDGLEIPERAVSGNTLVFYNGSLANYSVAVVNNRAMVNTGWFDGAMGTETYFDEETGLILIIDGETEVLMVAGLKEAAVNGDVFPLDVAPVYDGFIWVPLRFVAEALGAAVDYYDGQSARYEGHGGQMAEAAAHTQYVPRVKQIMVHKYPADAKALSSAEALAIAQKQVAEANKAARADFRVDTAKIRVFAENDRYYMLQVGFDFWVDKYTGDVYVFYNGQNMRFWKFDPGAEGALVFAG